MRLADAYAEGKSRLKAAEIAENDLDAWYLLEFAAGTDRTRFYAEPEREISDKQYREYLSYIERRAKHVPLQHITGGQEFMGLGFEVNENVLIPRQDTEVLVETALEILKKEKVPETDGETAILDMCTGSGCILISALYYLRKTKAGYSGTGADISHAALSVAKKNADRILGRQAGKSVRFVQGDLFAALSPPGDKEKYGMILSNPPYIRTAEIDTLEEEVRLHDPRGALDGHEDGLYFYRRISRESREYLMPGGYLLFEIGYDQAEEVVKIMREAGFCRIMVKKDLAGLDRVVHGVYNVNTVPTCTDEKKRHM